MGNRMKTSLTIDEDLWVAAKIAAARRRIRLADFFEEAIREKLERGDKLNGQKGKD